MSQAGIIGTGGMPSVPTSFVTDVNSPAVPVANVLNVLGGASTANDTDGIRTDGSSGSNTLTIQLTNRVQGTATTVGATTADPVTLALGATPGTYAIDVTAIGYTSTGPAGTRYLLNGAVRTSGAAATVIGTPEETLQEDVSLASSDVDFVASGNNLIIRVTGVAAVTINWRVLLTYTFVS